MKLNLPATLASLVLSCHALPLLSAEVPSVVIDTATEFAVGSGDSLGDTAIILQPTDSPLNVVWDGSTTAALTVSGAENATLPVISLTKEPASAAPVGVQLTRLASLDVSSVSTAWINLQRMNSSASVTIDAIGGDVTLHGNRLGRGYSPSPYGIVSLSSGNNNTILIDDIGGKFSIRDNTSAVNMVQSGLGLYIYGYSDDTAVENAIILSHIRGGVEVADNTASGGNGAISIFNDVYSGRADVVLRDIDGGVVFKNNAFAYSCSSCIAAGCAVESADETHAGIATVSLQNIRGGILFDNNSAGIGAAVFVNGSVSRLVIDGVEGDVVFRGNRAEMRDEGYGGAIYFQTGVVSEENLLAIANVRGDVIFDGNEAGMSGGAICSSASPLDESGADVHLLLHADGGNIVFRNNVMYGGQEQEQVNAVPNAILTDGRHVVDLAASEGRQVAFYDPIVMSDEEGLSELHFNHGDYSGEILFSGRDHSAAESVSTLTGNAFQHGGRVRLDQGAGLEVGSYSQQGGELVMGRGAVLKAENDVTLQNLVVTVASGQAGATILAGGTVSLSGVLAVEGALEDLVAGAQVLSVKADAGTIGNLGEGQREVVMRDGMGEEYTLGMDLAFNEAGELVFTTGEIVEQGVLAELQGGNVANSMLSSSANVRAFSDAVLRHVEPWRFSRQANNFWTEGLGGFLTQRTEGRSEGFDYQGGGFAVGYDTSVGREGLVGIAYGEFFGKNIGRDFQSTNEQTTSMGSVYGGWRRQLSGGRAVTVTGAFSYGYTDNDLSSRTAAGQDASGSWSNRTWDAAVMASYSMELGRRYALRPHIGVEYTDATQSRFAESGEMARRFGRGHYRNLALPVGITLDKTVVLSRGRVWNNALGLEYVPDVFRREAESDAELISSGYAWKARGSRPARNAVRATWSSHLRLNDAWSVYGSYRVEVRSSRWEQNVQAGVSYTF